MPAPAGDCHASDANEDRIAAHENIHSPEELRARHGIVQLHGLAPGGRSSHAILCAALAGNGLRITQYAILELVAKRGPLTISELAEWLVMDRTTIGRNLWPLEREGLIDIRVARHDRRAREVTLSESGREREAEARPAWQRAQDHFEREFDSGRATKMRREMLAIVETALSTPK
jgi:DNA-binding MarR family transcriptional regulator